MRASYGYGVAAFVVFVLVLISAWGAVDFSVAVTSTAWGAGFLSVGITFVGSTILGFLYFVVHWTHLDPFNKKYVVFEIKDNGTRIKKVQKVIVLLVIVTGGGLLVICDLIMRISNNSIIEITPETYDVRQDLLSEEEPDPTEPYTIA